MKLAARAHYATGRRIADSHNYHHHDNEPVATLEQLPGNPTSGNNDSRRPYYYVVVCPSCAGPVEADRGASRG